MTCTPYGINPQRLLVRGHRIPNADGEAKTTSDAMQLNALYIAPFIGIPICLAIVIYIFVVTSSRYLKRHGDRVGKYLSQQFVQAQKIFESREEANAFRKELDFSTEIYETNLAVSNKGDF